MPDSCRQRLLFNRPFPGFVTARIRPPQTCTDSEEARDQQRGDSNTVATDSARRPVRRGPGMVGNRLGYPHREVRQSPIESLPDYLARGTTHA